MPPSIYQYKKNCSHIQENRSGRHTGRILRSMTPDSSIFPPFTVEMPPRISMKSRPRLQAH
jgi:hypothetical protein